MALSATTPEGLVHRTNTPAPPRPTYLTSQGRDLRIDLLRGFCVLAMIVDHVGGASPLYLITGGNLFFTSAAEGFIITSGLAAGLVYKRLIARDGFIASAGKALRRAFSLYLLTVSLMLLLAPVSEFFGLSWARSLDLSHTVSFVVSVLTLHSTYYLSDVMLLYTLLFVLLPAALYLLTTGRTKVLLAASWLLWLLHQFFPWWATITWPINGNGLFLLQSWQVLFFTALVLGYHHDRMPGLSPRRLRGLHLLTGLAFAALLGLWWLLNRFPDRLPGQMIALLSEQVFDKAEVGPGRIMAAAAVFGFFYVSLTRWWTWLRRPLQFLLQPLGQNALYAFTVHALFSVIAALAVKLWGWPEGNLWLNSALQVSAVALTWLMARRQLLSVAPLMRVLGLR